MTYLDTLSKLAGSMSRAEAITLVLHAESCGAQSLYGICVTAAETGICGFTYDIAMEI